MRHQRRIAPEIEQWAGRLTAPLHNAWRVGFQNSATGLTWTSTPAARCRPRRAGDGSAAAGKLDVVGLSWTSWDLIEKVRRADQAHSKVTDARRTERGFHAAGNGETAGQRPFRWAGMGGL